MEPTTSENTEDDTSGADLIELILQRTEEIIYCNHILRETNKVVQKGLETALIDAMNLLSLGETFHLNCTPSELLLDNDVPLKPIPKDSLQI